MSEAGLLLGDLDLTRGPYSTHVGSSFGGWSSLTAETSSLFLDGARVSGEASGNREIVLRVRVEAPSRYALIEACEALLVEANKQSNTLTFSPDGGPDVVYEVFRVRAPGRTDDESEAWEYREYELVFPALPFARSAVRESTGALAPAITVAGFESSFTGAVLRSELTRTGDDWAIPVGSATATPIAEDYGLTATEFVAVSNASLSDSGGFLAVTPVATGADVEVRSAASWTVSGDYLTVAVKADAQAVSGHGPLVAGVEWLDASSAAIRVDWGTPRDVLTNSPSTDHFDVWATAPVPASATAARLRLRGAGAGSTTYPYEVRALVVVSSTSLTVTPSSTAAHDGATGINLTMGEDPSIDPPEQRAGYLHRALASPVDVSSVTSIGFWFQPKISSADLGQRTDAVSLRLWDSTGRWSRYWFRAGTLTVDTWAHLTAHITDDPWQVSDAGGVDPTDVAAFDIDIRHDGSGVYLDSLVAADAVSATTSPRGNIYELSPIIGSARSVARVEIGSSTNLTDWLLAAVTSDTGAPMLSVLNGVATAPAPALYDGVYSVIGGLPSGATALGTSCTISQKINGAEVATKTLTGLTRTGGHYVDYGAVSLPLVPVPADNQGVSFTFTFAAGSTGEVLLIDVNASLAWVDNLPTAMPYAWVDEPEAISSLGKVWIGTAADRSDARGLTAPPTLSRPLQVKAPSTRLLVYSTTTAPDVELSYFPRWLIEPTA